MYKQGDLKLHTACKRDNRNYCIAFETDDDHDCILSDSRGTDSVSDLPPGTVFLPHSCNQWIVGGRKQVETLIADLQTLLKGFTKTEPDGGTRDLTNT